MRWTFNFRDLMPGLVAAVLVTMITSLPQVYLWYERGSEWNGGLAYIDSDEFAYSAYVNALIHGRPRRNDPFTGKDNNNVETLYSIQFFPAYSIAIPARLLRLSADTAFIIFSLVLSFGSCLIIFVLLHDLTGDSLLSAIGSSTILLFGAFAAPPPWDFLAPHLSFPFLRRYVPAFPFPFFFAMIMFMWRALSRSSTVWAIMAALMFTLQIYSYFFLWTTAAAWLVLLAFLWLLRCQRGEYLNSLRVFGIVGGVGLLSLVPYSWLLSHRSTFIDDAQLLEFTHTPDILRGPEVYGMIMSLWFFRHLWTKPKQAFVLSFALVPVIVFNQQVITGRSLQPFHYAQFSTNYLVMVAAVYVLACVWKMSTRAKLLFAFGVLALGITYGTLIGRVTAKFNVEADTVRAAALHLCDQGTVFAPNRYLSTVIPSLKTNSVLWSRYLYTFSSVDRFKQKERFYQYLYYSAVSSDQFRQLLEGDNITARQEVFGAERANSILTSNHRQITEDEINKAVEEYVLFVDGFDKTKSQNPTLTYAIVQHGDDLTNLDKWYERDSGEDVKGFILYRLRLR